ncbi:hypothetical protein [Streptomyces sp. NPDC056512]|uniref:hypothetical protein n=1 Tax=Streptomyces sp. NPDC056512 TaxID=3345846 RepID=UPI0036871E61
MGLVGKLTGTKHPDAGVIPLPAGEVRAALHAVKRPDVPCVIRSGTPAERADLVAEWRVLEPAWRTFFSCSRPSRTLKTRMRLDAESHEVRALDEQWEVTWVGDTPRPARSRACSRGQVATVSRQWEAQRGPDGRLHRTEVFRFGPAEMKAALQDAVLGAGWSWRAVVFKL